MEELFRGFYTKYDSTASLANNGGQLENFLAQIAISINLEPRTSRTAINTLGEETPCQFLGHCHSGCEATARRWH